MDFSYDEANWDCWRKSFEGSPNDVPISTISRGIEIDLRQMLDENETIPEPYPETGHVQM